MKTETRELQHIDAAPFFLVYTKNKNNAYTFSVATVFGDDVKLLSKFQIEEEVKNVNVQENSCFKIETEEKEYFVDFDGKVFNSLEELLKTAINKGSTQKTVINDVDVYKIKYDKTYRFAIDTLLNGLEFCELSKIDERTKVASVASWKVKNNAEIRRFENAYGTKVACVPIKSAEFFGDRNVFGHLTESQGYSTTISMDGVDFHGFIESSDFNKIQNGDVKFIFDVDREGEPVYKYFNLKKDELSDLIFSYRFVKEFEKGPQEGLYAASCEKFEDGEYKPYGVFLNSDLTPHIFGDLKEKLSSMVISFKDGHGMCVGEDMSTIEIINKHGKVVRSFSRVKGAEEEILSSDLKDCMERYSAKERKAALEGMISDNLYFDKNKDSELLKYSDPGLKEK